MKSRKAIVLCLLMIFSLGSLALGRDMGQRNRNDRGRIERNRENGNSNRGDRGNWRRRHRRHYRRHWRRHM